MVIIQPDIRLSLLLSVFDTWHGGSVGTTVECKPMPPSLPAETTSRFHSCAKLLFLFYGLFWCEKSTIECTAQHSAHNWPKCVNPPRRPRYGTPTSKRCHQPWSQITCRVQAAAREWPIN